MIRCYIRKSLLLQISMLFFVFAGKAQLQADFTVDKEGGCAPLSVQFTNTTTGNSANAIYQWSFDNGNQSQLQDAGAIFYDQRPYTITLTVTDQGKTAVKTKIITVYKNPAVDFTASLSKGCAPLAVNFTANATPGDGSVAGFFWDFGDGETGGSGTAAVNHTYTKAQQVSVIVVVTNNYGCRASKTINNILEVLPGAVASFDAANAFLCYETDTVKLLNHSTGLAPLTYAWDFGDGASSAVKDPAHVFNKKGSYTVSLMVQNAVGCRDTLTNSGYLNVANFKSDFTLPSTICKRSATELINTSTPVPSSYTWVIDNKDTVVADNWDYKYRYTAETAGNHDIKLINQFGQCTQTLTQTAAIKELLQPKGFVVDVPTYCFTPVTVAFHDTTTGAVKTEWNFERYNYPIQPQATGKDASYTFGQPSFWWVTLFVTDARGCVDSIGKVVPTLQPEVFISLPDDYNKEGCDSLARQFTFTTTEKLVDFTWDFNDGTTSKDSVARHMFTKLGANIVFLHYTTDKGCKGTSYSYVFDILKRPTTGFRSLFGDTICGNSRAQFQMQNNSYYGYWYVDSVYGSSDYSLFGYNFMDTGYHTVKLLEGTYGCYDSASLKVYVAPAIAKISEAKNTCIGDRGTVTFRQNSKYAKQWIWDFGDGTRDSLSTDQEYFNHHYDSSGRYLVHLSVVNGGCTTQDSIIVYVFVKQSPVLSAAKTSFCKDEGLSFTLSNLKRHPYDGIWIWHYQDHFEYNDGEIFSTLSYQWDDSWIFVNPFSNNFKGIVKGKDSVRLVLRSPYFDCFDTTNFIPIKLLGADAAFTVSADTVCYGTPVRFSDTSSSYNTQIISRKWNWGDGTSTTTTTAQSLLHNFTAPGLYNVTLTVTDDAGCSATSASTAHPVVVNGPQAIFTASQTTAPLNTSIQFYNGTNTFNSANATFKWLFGDGTGNTDYNTSHTFAVYGDYSVKLIAANNETGCRDTALQIIHINNFSAGFTFAASAILNSSCPPVLFSFRNTSLNADYTRWDFGDGNVVENADYPTHVYTSPGKYIVTLLIKNNNGLVASFKDSVVIGRIVNAIAANPKHVCTSKLITLTADANKAVGYSWDFGDGVTSHGTDSFSMHTYRQAGIYYPGLISTDSAGCTTAVRLPDPVIIDSLYISLSNVPEKICVPKQVFFTPLVVSVAGNQSPQNLRYHWDFGTAEPGDTANVLAPVFNYTRTGNYFIKLTVQSVAGCIKEATAPVTAFQGLGPKINGPQSVCEGASVLFTASSQIPGQPLWKWIFEDGSVSMVQNPPARVYNAAGNQQIKLVATNEVCSDTVSQVLIVNAKPVIKLSPATATICENQGVTINASGGVNYDWSPAAGLNTVSGATVTASPLAATVYSVSVTNTAGCVKADSITVGVVHPFTLTTAAAIGICAGKTITLSASGASTYQWINYTAGLSNTNTANPSVTPLSSATFTVTGRDALQCFSDTATVSVTVFPAPAVDAGVPITVMPGEASTINAVYSNDVMAWDWQPAKYLDCYNCPQPVLKPYEELVYTVKATNANGCSATDTVSVHLLCGQSRIYIPLAFSPNEDGKNDRFLIKGQGVTLATRLTVYNRYGQVIFQKQHFKLDDNSAAWDGTYRGEKVAAGNYVYFVEMLCNGTTFTRKGSVIVIY